jgi:hypothetical protein
MATKAWALTCLPVDEMARLVESDMPPSITELLSSPSGGQTNMPEGVRAAARHFPSNYRPTKC